MVGSASCQLSVLASCKHGCLALRRPRAASFTREVGSMASEAGLFDFCTADCTACLLRVCVSTMFEDDLDIRPRRG